MGKRSKNGTVTKFRVRFIRVVLPNQKLNDVRHVVLMTTGTRWKGFNILKIPLYKKKTKQTIHRSNRVSWILITYRFSTLIIVWRIPVESRDFKIGNFWPVIALHMKLWYSTFYYHEIIRNSVVMILTSSWNGRWVCTLFHVSHGDIPPQTRYSVT